MAQPLSIQFASNCAFAASTRYNLVTDEPGRQDTSTMTLKTDRIPRLLDPNPDSNGSFETSRFDNYFNIPQGFAECFVFGGGSTLASRSSMGFVALGAGQRENQALIAFRGSEFNNQASMKAIRRDFYIDGAAAPGSSPKGWAVHSGFASVFKSCLPEIQEIFRRLPYIHSVHCVGHSMGGALATLAAEHFIDSGKTPFLYTFGAPRVGLAPHTAYMTMRMSDRIFRYYFNGDFVTWMPMLPYVHLPGKRLIYNGRAASHTGYADTKNLIVAAGSEALTKDARAEAENLIAQGGSVGGGYGLESRAFRYFMKALNKILLSIGQRLGLMLITAATIVDQIVATLAYLVTLGGSEKPLIIRWMTGSFKVLGKFIKNVTVNLVANLRYLLNIMVTQLHINTERELTEAERFAQKAQRGQRVPVRNPRPNQIIQRQWPID